MEWKTPEQRWSRKHEANGSRSHHMATDIMAWQAKLRWKEVRKPLPKVLYVGEIPGDSGKEDEYHERRGKVFMEKEIFDMSLVAGT